MTQTDVIAKQFSKEEIDLLAYGFGYFVQEFSLEDGPETDLLEKLFSLQGQQSVRDSQ